MDMGQFLSDTKERLDTIPYDEEGEFQYRLNPKIWQEVIDFFFEGDLISLFPPKINIAPFEKDTVSVRFHSPLFDLLLVFCENYFITFCGQKDKIHHLRGHDTMETVKAVLKAWITLKV